MPEQASSEAQIELLFEKFSSFVDGYASNLSLGGMFLETEDFRAVGSLVDFEIKLTDGFRLVQGLGEVVWVRRRPAGPERPAGMGVRFQALDDKGRELVLKILEEQVRSGGEPFDVEEVPADVVSEPESEVSPQPDEAEESPAADSEPNATPLDVEQKILGEDGFTLLDTELAAPGPSAAEQERAFEELTFDAPWGEELPELPEEVFEEAQNDRDTVPPAAAEEPLPPDGAEELKDVSDPFAALAEIEGTLAQDRGFAQDAVDAMAPEETLEASLSLAEEAANEIELAPQAGPLAAPEFDDIDFGVPGAGDEDLVADFAVGEPAATPPGAPVDEAFERDFEADFETPRPSWQADESPLADDPFGEDATLVTGEPSAPEASFEDMPLDSAEELAPEASFEDAETSFEDVALALDTAEAPTFLTSESLAPAAEDATFLTSEPLAPAAEDASLLTSEPWAPAEDAPLLTSERPAPEVAETVMPSLSIEAVGSATVTAGGMPVGVQDYEDDLFAEDSSAGSMQVLRQSLGSRSILVALILVALAAAGYYFRRPLAELVGLAEPGIDVVAVDGHATGPPAVADDRQMAEAPDPSPVEGEAGIEAGADPGTAAIEEVEVRESLPAGVDVSNDPAAESTASSPAAEPAIPALVPAPSPAARVQRISWQRGDTGTRVTVTLDGELEEGRSIHEPLGYAPAREMVRITGIAEPYASGRIAVGSPELQQIRVGHHVEAGGGELHIVFDFPGAGPRITEVQSRGDRLEILISAR